MKLSELQNRVDRSFLQSPIFIYSRKILAQPKTSVKKKELGVNIIARSFAIMKSKTVSDYYCIYIYNVQVFFLGSKNPTHLQNKSSRSIEGLNVALKGELCTIIQKFRVFRTWILLGCKGVVVAVVQTQDQCSMVVAENLLVVENGYCLETWGLYLFHLVVVADVRNQNHHRPAVLFVVEDIRRFPVASSAVEDIRRQQCFLLFYPCSKFDCDLLVVQCIS